MSLEVRIWKDFGGFKLDVDFMSEGGCRGILGASGCGKSMTLKCIAGIERPDSGRIVLNGKVLFDSERNVDVRPQERKVGYLFQHYALFPTMTVAQNIQAGMPGGREEKRRRLSREVGRFQLEGLEGRYPSQLSGGQQQRVALARMLASEPDILMFDEPFSALDSFLRDTLKLELQELLRHCQKDALIVSHSRDEMYQFCDTMTILDQGKSILSGKAQDIFINPRKTVAARLTGCKNLSRARKAGEYEVEAEEWNIRLRTAVPVPDDLTHVGIRAHHLVPSEDPGEENAMRVVSAGYTEAPFKRQYLFANAAGGSGRMWWLVNQVSIVPSRQHDLPPCLVFPKESLLLLT